MADFSKQTEVKATFDAGDIHSVSISGGTYSNSLSITTKASDIVSLNFKSTEELMNFTNLVISVAHKADWHREYMSSYVYASDKDNLTINDLKMWEMSHSEHEARAEEYRAQQD